MRLDELKSVAARHVPGAGPLDFHRLSNGLVNETYRVWRDGSAYAMRVAASNPPLGIDRAWEARLLECAALGGVAPPLEYCDPRRGILIARWIDGVRWTAMEVRQPANISRMAHLMRRVHALAMPKPARLMSPLKWIDEYSEAARSSAGVKSRGGVAPRVAASLRSTATRYLAALAALPHVEPVVCHSDLHTLNLIDRGHSLVLLDWEYAHAADPVWDLAGWSANNDFEDGLAHDLLTNYTERPPTPGEYLRLHHLRWLYDYVCLLWYERQGVAARTQQLEARLMATSSGRAD